MADIKSSITVDLEFLLGQTNEQELYQNILQAINLAVSQAAASAGTTVRVDAGLVLDGKEPLAFIAALKERLSGAIEKGARDPKLTESLQLVGERVNQTLDHLAQMFRGGTVQSAQKTFFDNLAAGNIRGAREAIATTKAMTDQLAFIHRQTASLYSKDGTSAPAVFSQLGAGVTRLSALSRDMERMATTASLLQRVRLPEQPTAEEGKLAKQQLTGAYRNLVSLTSSQDPGIASVARQQALEISRRLRPLEETADRQRRLEVLHVARARAVEAGRREAASYPSFADRLIGNARDEHAQAALSRQFKEQDAKGKTRMVEVAPSTDLSKLSALGDQDLARIKHYAEQYRADYADLSRRIQRAQTPEELEALREDLSTLRGRIHRLSNDAARLNLEDAAVSLQDLATTAKLAGRGITKTSKALIESRDFTSTRPQTAEIQAYEENRKRFEKQLTQIERVDSLRASGDNEVARIRKRAEVAQRAAEEWKKQSEQVSTPEDMAALLRQFRGIRTSVAQTQTGAERWGLGSTQEAAVRTLQGLEAAQATLQARQKQVREADRVLVQRDVGDNAVARVKERSDEIRTALGGVFQNLSYATTIKEIDEVLSRLKVLRQEIPSLQSAAKAYNLDLSQLKATSQALEGLREDAKARRDLAQRQLKGIAPTAPVEVVQDVAERRQAYVEKRITGGEIRREIDALGARLPQATTIFDVQLLRNDVADLMRDIRKVKAEAQEFKFTAAEQSAQRLLSEVQLLAQGVRDQSNALRRGTPQDKFPSLRDVAFEDPQRARDYIRTVVGTTAGPELEGYRERLRQSGGDPYALKAVEIDARELLKTLREIKSVSKDLKFTEADAALKSLIVEAELLQQEVKRAGKATVGLTPAAVIGEEIYRGQGINLEPHQQAPVRQYLTEHIDLLKQEAEAQASRVKAVKEIGEQYPGQMSEARTKLDEVNKTIYQHTRDLRNVERSIRGISSAWEQANMMAQAFFRYGIGYQALYGIQNVVRQLIGASADLEQALKGIAAITRASDSDMVRIETTVKAVSGQFQFAAKDIAEAAQVMAQAGFNADKLAGSLKSVAEYASATGTDIKTAAQGVVIAENVFGGPKGLNADEISNQLAATVNVSRLQGQDITTLSNYLFQTGKKYNNDMPTLLGAAAALSNQGVMPSTIGTGLRTLMNELAKPDTKMITGLQAAYSNLGVGKSREDIAKEFFAVSQQDNSLLAFLHKLKDELKIDTVNRESFGRALDQRAENVLLPLLDAMGKAGKEGEAAGTSIEALALRISYLDAASVGSAKQLEGVEAALQRLGSTIVSLSHDGLKPFFDEVARGSATLADWLSRIRAQATANTAAGEGSALPGAIATGIGAARLAYQTVPGSVFGLKGMAAVAAGVGTATATGLASVQGGASEIFAKVAEAVILALAFFRKAAPEAVAAAARPWIPKILTGLVAGFGGIWRLAAVATLAVVSSLWEQVSKALSTDRGETATAARKQATEAKAEFDKALSALDKFSNDRVGSFAAGLKDLIQKLEEANGRPLPTTLVDETKALIDSFLADIETILNTPVKERTRRQKALLEFYMKNKGGSLFSRDITTESAGDVARQLREYQTGQIEASRQDVEGKRGAAIGTDIVAVQRELENQFVAPAEELQSRMEGMTSISPIMPPSVRAARAQATGVARQNDIRDTEGRLSLLLTKLGQEGDASRLEAVAPLLRQQAQRFGENAVLPGVTKEQARVAFEGLAAQAEASARQIRATPGKTATTEGAVQESPEQQQQRRLSEEATQNYNRASQDLTDFEYGKYERTSLKLDLENQAKLATRRGQTDEAGRYQVAAARADKEFADREVELQQRKLEAQILTTPATKSLFTQAGVQLGEQLSPERLLQIVAQGLKGVPVEGGGDELAKVREAADSLSSSLVTAANNTQKYADAAEAAALKLSEQALKDKGQIYGFQTQRLQDELEGKIYSTRPKPQIRSDLYKVQAEAEIAKFEEYRRTTTNPDVLKEAERSLTDKLGIMAREAGIVSKAGQAEYGRQVYEQAGGALRETLFAQSPEDPFLKRDAATGRILAVEPGQVEQQVKEAIKVAEIRISEDPTSQLKVPTTVEAEALRNQVQSTLDGIQATMRPLTVPIVVNGQSSAEATPGLAPEVPPVYSPPPVESARLAPLPPLPETTSSPEVTKGVIAPTEAVPEEVRRDLLRRASGGFVPDPEKGGLAPEEGELPGYGGGDRVPALLEPGEYIIRKEAVKKYGVAALDEINSMHAADTMTWGGRRYAAGGGVDIPPVPGGKAHVFDTVVMNHVTLKDVKGDALSQLTAPQARPEPVPVEVQNTEEVKPPEETQVAKEEVLKKLFNGATYRTMVAPGLGYVGGPAQGAKEAMDAYFAEKAQQQIGRIALPNQFTLPQQEAVWNPGFTGAGAISGGFGTLNENPWFTDIVMAGAPAPTRDEFTDESGFAISSLGDEQRVKEAVTARDLARADARMARGRARVEAKTWQRINSPQEQEAIYGQAKPAEAVTPNPFSTGSPTPIGVTHEGNSFFESAESKAARAAVLPLPPPAKPAAVASITRESRPSPDPSAVLAMVHEGEVVLPKKVVRRLGRDGVGMLMSLDEEIPQFAEGGAVGGAASLAQSMYMTNFKKQLEGHLLGIINGAMGNAINAGNPGFGGANNVSDEAARRVSLAIGSLPPGMRDQAILEAAGPLLAKIQELRAGLEVGQDYQKNGALGMSADWYTHAEQQIYELQTALNRIGFRDDIGQERRRPIAIPKRVDVQAVHGAGGLETAAKYKVTPSSQNLSLPPDFDVAKAAGKGIEIPKIPANMPAAGAPDTGLKELLTKLQRTLPDAKTTKLVFEHAGSKAEGNFTQKDAQALILLLQKAGARTVN